MWLCWKAEGDAGHGRARAFDWSHAVGPTRANRRRRPRNYAGGVAPPPRPSSAPPSTRQRATDQEIQKWISRQHGFVPESAWILHCKEQFGLIAPASSTTNFSYSALLA